METLAAVAINGPPRRAVYGPRDHSRPNKCVVNVDTSTLVAMLVIGACGPTYSPKAEVVPANGGKASTAPAQAPLI